MTIREFRELANECGEMHCSNPPTHVVYWPGRNPPPVYCEYHTLRAMEILNLMGCFAHFEEIKRGKEKA